MYHYTKWTWVRKMTLVCTMDYRIDVTFHENEVEVTIKFNTVARSKESADGIIEDMTAAQLAMGCQPLRPISFDPTGFLKFKTILHKEEIDLRSAVEILNCLNDRIVAFLIEAYGKVEVSDAE